MKKKSSRFSRYLPYLKNKYLLTFLGFLVWLSFFDRNDFITTWNYHRKLVSLRNERAYYEKEVAKYDQDLQLRCNMKALEKYARERYLMKRDNEDVFVIMDLPSGKSN